MNECRRLTVSPFIAGGGAAGCPEEDEADRGRTGQIFGGLERRPGETGTVREEGCRREWKNTHTGRFDSHKHGEKERRVSLRITMMFICLSLNAYKV